MSSCLEKEIVTTRGKVLNIDPKKNTFSEFDIKTNTKFSILNELRRLKGQRLEKYWAFNEKIWNIQFYPISYMNNVLKKEMLKVGYMVEFVELMFYDHNDFAKVIYFDEWVLNKLNENLRIPNDKFYRDVTKSNLDLIFKWLSAKFQFYNKKNKADFLIKCIPYVNAIFDILIRDKYFLNEFESAFFVQAFYENFLNKSKQLENIQDSLRILSDKILQTCDFYVIFSSIKEIIQPKIYPEHKNILQEFFRITKIETFLTLNDKKKEEILFIFSRISIDLKNTSFKEIMDLKINDFLCKLPLVTRKTLLNCLKGEELMALTNILSMKNISFKNKNLDLNESTNTENKEKDRNEFISYISKFDQEEDAFKLIEITQNLISFIPEKRNIIEIEEINKLLSSSCKKIYRTFFEMEISMQQNPANRLYLNLFKNLKDLVLVIAEKRMKIDAYVIEKCLVYLFALHQLKLEGYFKLAGDYLKSSTHEIFIEILSMIGFFRGSSILLRLFQNRSLVKYSLDFENKEKYLEDIKKYMRKMRLVSFYVRLSKEEIEKYLEKEELFHNRIKISIDIVRVSLRNFLGMMSKSLEELLIEEDTSEVFDTFIPRCVKFIKICKEYGYKNKEEISGIYVQLLELFNALKKRFPDNIKEEF
ncbi:unnamed protein product [Brachionus calyciflorus]|uniref:Uncharacterized protein n=1 Tax=Brachionus calyciflorus TaxID=104777 RepID=A0A813LVU8_9BILA|nr:unnamed protein product [Brachionus calyciflorus]